MLHSEDFKQHDIEWRVSAVEGGSRVTMRVRVVPRIPVPQALIRSVIGGALGSTLVRLDSLLQM